MPKGKFIGIDIGGNRLKLSLLSGGKLLQFASEPMPENIIKDGQITSWTALGDFIKSTMQAHKMRAKVASVVVPMRTLYTRRVSLPLMTTQQLKLNLPYEFHDYITDDSDKYFYDYSVINIGEDRMDLEACAMEKASIENYVNACKRAGLKLEELAPELSSHSRCAMAYQKKNGIEDLGKDYAFLDLGDSAIRIHFYTKGIYEVTRSLDIGISSLIQTYAQAAGIDIHKARMDFEINADNCQNREDLADDYADIAVQIMRVMNFYSFNNRENNIEEVWYYGGGSYIKPLIDQINDQLDIQLKPFAELMPAGLADDDSKFLGALSSGIGAPVK